MLHQLLLSYNYFSKFAANNNKERMKILKISYVCALMVVYGCGLTNMANKYETVNFSVTPPILQTHGGEVQLSIDVTFPEKYFAKQVLTASLKLKGG